MFDIWSHSSRSWACVRLNIYSCFLSETIETYWRGALRIAFESPRKCVWVTWELFSVTSELPSTHLGRNCVWDNSELRLSHLGITFESPRNYVWMTLIPKLVAIAWPLVTYRVPPVNSLITEEIPHGPEHACVRIYIPDFHQTIENHWRDAIRIAFESPRNSVWVTKLWIASESTRNYVSVTSESRLSHLGIKFESPRNNVWMTLISKLVAIVWPLVTYRVFPVNCLIAEIIPHGPEHACVRIYSWFLSESIETNSREALQNCIRVTSELLLSHLGIAFESPSSDLRLRQLGITFEPPRNHVWVASELRLNDLDRKIGRYRLTPCNISCASS